MGVWAKQVFGLSNRVHGGMLLLWQVELIHPVTDKSVAESALVVDK